MPYIIFIMRKFLLVLLLLFNINLVFADETRTDRLDLYQKKIEEIGFRILMSNHLDNRVTFKYVDSEKVKDHHSTRKKIIMIHKGLIPYFDSDDEIAAVLSYRLGVMDDNYRGFFRRLSMNYSPLKYDKKNLRRTVDYMVHAGYDPVAAIIMLNKNASQTDWYDCHIMNYQGLREMMYLYYYIYDKYPVYLEDNKYAKNIYYQNFLLISQKERENIRKINAELLKIEKATQKDNE